MIHDTRLSDVIYFHLERTMRRVKEHTRELFKEEGFDITIDQWVLLKRIGEVQDITQIDLANSTFKEPAAVTRMLNILEKQNLILRKRSEVDRRAFIVSLTENGKDLVKTMTPHVQDIRSKGLNNFTESDIDTLKRLVTKIYHNFD